ncbi:hypothetical protein [Paenibacillus polymyxa]|uniref:hypothetical protein n=1 Tax=Paenibacillus polymyxa TaxID=1406 RepID=UPI00202573C7|nr:hypothetical protein [Paenibacillus polymyxa]WDZ59051.1 hypothetical protein MF626_08290 [Paenibacillus polymyxa]
MIFRSLLQWDSLDYIEHSKVRIPLQRRTLALLQIQMDRSAAFRRGVTVFNLPPYGGSRKGVSEGAARLKPLLPIKYAIAVAEGNLGKALRNLDYLKLASTAGKF